MLRKILFWIHLTVGLSVGIIVLVMSVTGVLLTYQKQMTTWADLREARSALAAQPESRPALPVSTLLERVAADPAAPPSKPTSVVWRSDSATPVEVVYGRDGRVFVDPSTGVVLSEGSAGMRTFFSKVVEWHRWLGATGEKRDRGGMITGAANLGFLFLVVSGLFLWWPRNWSLRGVRNVTWFRRGLTPKARDFNWHNVIGFWMLIPLFFVVLSGVVISYGWAGNLVYRWVGEQPPAQGAGAIVTSAPRVSRPTSAPDLDNMFSAARARVADWRIITVQLPKPDAEQVTFSIDRGFGGEPHKRAQLKFDAATGSPVEWLPFSSGTPGRQLRTILRFAHTGEVAGVIGQTLAGIASLGATVLVWTGISLALRRLAAWRTRRRNPFPTLQSEIS